MCPLMRSERDKCTNRDTRSFTWSKDLDCIVDTRWTSQLAWRRNQPGPRSRHNSLSAFMLAASLSLVAIFTFDLVFACLLGHTRHISKRLQQNLRSAGLQLLHMRQWMSCNNEELRSLPRFWSRPQHLCDPRSGLEQLGAASESRTSRDPVVTIPQAATVNAREVSADSCSTCLRSRASPVVRTVIGVSSYEAASKKRIGAMWLRNASDWMRWRKTPWSRLMHALSMRYMFFMKVLLVM